jgi:hypothetical protein
LKNTGFKVTDNPDIFQKVQNEDSINTLFESEDKPNKIKYSEWVKVQEDGKYRYKLKPLDMNITDYQNMFQEKFKEFSTHCHRVQHQFQEMRKLRKDLPTGHALGWMDFAENFNCTSVEQPQNAYWNNTSVTLHTMVVYLPDGEEHHSFVAVSDEMSHGPATVYAIIRKLVPYVKSIYSRLTDIHYLTDSPTSQYRNKTIFLILTLHKEEFGVSARWNYLEAGHGKGPCDGLGASVKRGANNAVIQNKAVIQDAEDFYSYTQSEACKSKVDYCYVSKQDVQKAKNDLDQYGDLKRVVGTMKMHAVCPMGVDERVVLTKELSCYSECCKLKPSSACSWEEHTLTAKSAQQRADHSQECQEDDIPKMGVADAQIDMFVAVMYDDEWYISQIAAIDAKKNEIQVKFMTKSQRGDQIILKWEAGGPVWVTEENLLCMISPLPVGQKKRSYILLDTEYAKAESCGMRFKSRKIPLP